MWTALDVFIGLTLCYALISLFCTAIQEFMTQLFNAKGKLFADALVTVGLDDLEEQLRLSFLSNPGSVGFPSLVRPSNQEDDAALIEERVKKAKNWLSKPFMALENFWKGRRALVNMPPEKIAATILVGKNLIANGKSALELETDETLDTKIDALELPRGLATALKALEKGDRGSVKKVEAVVEQWVDSFLAEIEHWSKRRAQIYSLIIGLAVAVGLNVDTIAIAQSLATDPEKRALVVELAENVNEAGEIRNCPVPHADDDTDAATSETAETGSAEKDLAACLDAINDAYPFALGWPTKVDFGEGSTRDNIFQFLDEVWAGLDPVKIVGFLLTAIALSLGSRFWFDTLTNLLALRSGGKVTKSNKPDP